MEKEIKFTQPFAMKCNAEQYGKLDKDRLEGMGYEFQCIGSFNEEEYGYLVNYYTGKSGIISNIYTYVHWKGYEREYLDGKSFIVIDTWNEELFFALASMTNQEYGIVGEWWEFIDNFCNNGFIVGKLYPIIKADRGGHRLMYAKGGLNGWEGKFHVTHFCKATAEQLINKLTKTETMEELKFESEKEFAIGILQHGELWDDRGKRYFTDKDDRSIRFYFADAGELKDCWSSWESHTFYTSDPTIKEEVVLTMDEIAKLAKCDVEQLRIKE
jgi:hypothetical protein